MIKSLSILVSGRVQGVFFRASTKAKADELGIAGIVRNEPGGQVYIEAEGEEGPILLFEKWCNEGPRLAYVEGVEVRRDIGVRGYKEFTIVR
jgi:acylphosphatase